MSNLVPDDGFGDFNRIFIEGKDADPDRIDDAVNSFPMMAEKSSCDRDRKAQKAGNIYYRTLFKTRVWQLLT